MAFINQCPKCGENMGLTNLSMCIDCYNKFNLQQKNTATPKGFTSPYIIEVSNGENNE